MATNLMWWKKAKSAYENELKERESFNRTHISLCEYDFEKEFAKEYTQKLGYWRPYLYDAINKYLSQPYQITDYSTNELEKIVSQLDEAIMKAEKEK
jgi:predicted GNAT superfamily acetyltransferase